MKAIQWLVALLALSLVSFAEQPLPAAFSPGAKPDTIVHRSSGFTFPASIGLFKREEATQFEPSGQDVSVGYNAGVLIAATIYVYPRDGRSLATELTDCGNQIVKAHPGATLLGQPRDLTVSPGKIPARATTYTFTSEFMGESQPLKSELIVAQHGNRFVKFRITYPAANASRAAEEIATFLKAFAWP